MGSHQKKEDKKMRYDFDEVICRDGTFSMKWDGEFLKTEFGTDDLLPLWVADMDFQCPQPVIEALRKRVEHGIFGYSHRTDAYYEAVISWMARRHQWKIEKDWIVFSAGIVPAINYIIHTFTRPGDKVIIQNPVYYPFGNAIVNNGRRPLFNSLKFTGDRYHMDFEGLKALAKDPYAKLMILCSPHNPVGRVWEKEELISLGEICAENNILVVSDEIHSDLILRGHVHTPFAGISDEFAQNAIVCTAPSKTFNLAGLQTSNLIIPDKIKRQEYVHTLERNHGELTNCFGIVSLVAAYTQGEEWLEQVLDYIEGNVDFIDDFIKTQMPEVKFIRPEGTYLGWLDFRSVCSDGTSLEQIMQKKAKVALDEGYIFGEGGEGFERINLACSKKIIAEAMERIEKAIHNRP